MKLKSAKNVLLYGWWIFKGIYPELLCIGDKKLQKYFFYGLIYKEPQKIFKEKIKLSLNIEAKNFHVLKSSSRTKAWNR